jgi:MvdD-like protein with pre-ATP grasp domain
MILIVAPRQDVHALCVAQDLEKMGQPFRFVDSARLASEGRLEFRAGRRHGSTWTCVDGEPIELERVRTVWHRRRLLPPVAARCAINDQQYFQREWTEMFSGIFASLHDAWFVNLPERQSAAVKPLQLRLAQQLGLRVPDTLITNDPVAAAAFIELHEERVVHKTLSPPRHRFLATKAWSVSDCEMLDNLVLAPTIFQEMVTDCRELRITVIGERVFAAEFRPPAGLIDGRLDLQTPYRPHTLPPDISTRLMALVRQLGLVFSTVDMKLTDEGEYVFLELNPMGQFLYVEILTGLPLTAAMAELLGAGRPTVDCCGSRQETRRSNEGVSEMLPLLE